MVNMNYIRIKVEAAMNINWQTKLGVSPVNLKFVKFINIYKNNPNHAVRTPLLEKSKVIKVPLMINFKFGPMKFCQVISILLKFSKHE